MDANDDDEIVDDVVDDDDDEFEDKRAADSADEVVVFEFVSIFVDNPVNVDDDDDDDDEPLFNVTTGEIPVVVDGLCGSVSRRAARNFL